MQPIQFLFCSQRPSKPWRVIVSGLCLSLCAGRAVSDPAPMPTGSYLVKPAITISALVKQVETEPKVAERYARLFHISARQVSFAFADLQLIRLPADLTTSVWNVKPSRQGEKQGYKSYRLKKGTWVFALADGTPALVQVCGNPMRDQLPSHGSYMSTGQMPGPEIALPSQPTLNITMPAPQFTRAADAPGDWVEDDVLPVSPPTPAQPEDMLRKDARKRLIDWLFPLLLTPLFAGGGDGSTRNASGSGGSSSNLTPPNIIPPIVIPSNPVNPKPPIKENPLAPPTPEPGFGMLASVFSLMAFALTARKYRRASRSCSSDLF